MKSYKLVNTVAVIGLAIILSACGGGGRGGGGGITATPPPTSPPVSRVVVSRTQTGQVTQVLSLNEDGTGKTILLTGNPASVNESFYLTGKSANGRLVFDGWSFDSTTSTNTKTLLSVKQDGSGAVTLAAPAASTATVVTTVEYCGMTPNNRVIYSVMTDSLPRSYAAQHLTSQVYSRVTDGSSAPVNLSKTSNVEVCEVVQPDGSVFVSRTVRDPATWVSGVSGMYKYSEDGTQAEVNLLTYKNAIGKAYVNPEGYTTADGHLVFTYAYDAFATYFSISEIVAVMPDGTGAVDLTPVVTAPDRVYDAFAVITKNDEVVVEYFLTQYVPPGPFPDGKVMIAKMGTASSAWIYPAAQSASGFSSYYDDSSTDGRLVFSYESTPPSGTPTAGLYSINPATGNTTRILTSSGVAWFPILQGNQIVYAVTNRAVPPATNDTYLIGSVNSDGTGLKTLTSGSGAINVPSLHLSPSGRAVYSVQTTSPYQSDIYSIKLDGTGLVALANSIDNELFLSVTGNDRVIYSHESSVAGIGGVYSVKADGASLIYLNEILSPARSSLDGTYTP